MAALLGAVAPAGAQVTGSAVPAARTVPVADQLKEEVEESRFRLGPLRLTPAMEIRDAGYDSNLFGTETNRQSDWTATVAAGTRWIVPVGAHTWFRGTAMPAYVWYARRADGRTFGGLYDASAVLVSNRISVAARGAASKVTALLNSETARRVLTETRSGEASVDVRVAGATHLFASGRRVRFDYRSSPEAPPDAGSDPNVLDRTEEAGDAGILREIDSGFSLSAAIETTTATFRHREQGGDNRSTAYLVGVLYDRPRFFVNLSAGYRRAEPDGAASRFPELATATGSAFVSWLPTSRLDLHLYGSRGIGYSGASDGPYYVESRGGASLDFQVGHRITLRGFGEYGTNRYPVRSAPPEGGPAVRRRDEIVDAGGGFEYAFSPRAAFSILASEERHDSDFPGATRSYLRVNAGVRLEISRGVRVRGAFS